MKPDDRPHGARSAGVALGYRTLRLVVVLLEAVAVWVGSIVMVLVLDVVAGIVGRPRLGMSAEQPAGLIVSATFLIVLTVWRARAAFGSDWTEVIAWQIPRFRLSWGKALLAVALFFAMAIAWNYALSVVLDDDPYVMVPEGGAWIPYGADLILIGPVAEELFFRGFLQARLQRVLPVSAAVVVTALLFAAVHKGATWFHPVSVLPMSLVWGWLREKTASLLPGLALHALNNGLYLALLWLA